MLKVLICDDHTLVRAGLRRLLDSFGDIEVVAEASSAAGEISALAKTRILPVRTLVAEMNSSGPRLAQTWVKSKSRTTGCSGFCQNGPQE